MPIILLIGYAFAILTSGYRPFNRNILEDGYIYYDLRIKGGDDPHWSKKELDDDHWEQYLTPDKGLFWFRTRMEIDAPIPPFKMRGLKIEIRGSYDLYWDGVLIGQNGKVGHTKAEEIPGLYQQIFIIPDSLAKPGLHQLAFRISNHFDPFIQYPRLLTGEYLNLSREPLVLTLFIHLVAGIFLFAFIYYYFLFFLGSDPQGSFLILGTLCFLLFALTIFEYLKFYHQYPYSFQSVRLLIIEYLILGISMLLPLFYLYYYKRSYKLQINLLLLIPLLSILFFLTGPDKRAFYLIFTGLFSSLSITLWAYLDKAPNTKINFAGLLICTLCLWFYFDLSLFLGFGVLILTFLIALARQRKEEKANFRASLLKASRLEVELLKKKIQPHFLMNTLTSLINIVEESPRDAVNFIHALAELFDILNEISDRSTIPIRKELELCAAHLKVMSYRKDIQYSMQTSNISDKELLPPATLLTIIENGISHNKAVNGKMNFCIQFFQDDGSKTYTTISSGLQRKKTTAEGDGIGHKYIKARLQECYKDKWDFSSQHGPNGWETSFTIYQG